MSVIAPGQECDLWRSLSLGYQSGELIKLEPTQLRQDQENLYNNNKCTEHVYTQSKQIISWHFSHRGAFMLPCQLICGKTRWWRFWVKLTYGPLAGVLAGEVCLTRGDLKGWQRLWQSKKCIGRSTGGLPSNESSEKKTQRGLHREEDVFPADVTSAWVQICVEELTVTAISPKLVPSSFPMCDDHHEGVSRRFQDARHKTVIYDSCNLHTYCLNRDPLLFKHTWFLMDRLLEEPQRSHDDSSMEGVTESSTVGCPVADADMAEESNQETAMDLRTVIPETQVHGQNCAERTWRNLIKLETDCPHHKRANAPYYTRYVHVRASVICYCSKCGSKYVSERTKLRSEEATPGSRGEASHFLEDENDERNGPNDCVLYTGDLMGATECPKCKETRFDDRGKAKKEYFYFSLLETAHGLTLSEDVPQYVSDIRETAMWNEMHKEERKSTTVGNHLQEIDNILLGLRPPPLDNHRTPGGIQDHLQHRKDCSPMLGKYRKLWNEVATDQSLQTISKRQIQEEVNTSRLLEQLPALKAVLVQGDNQAVKGHLQRYGGTFTDAFNYGNNAKQAKEKANRQHHPDSDTDYFHEVDSLRQSIVDCVSGEHSKCSFELGCPEYPSNPDSRGPAPVIPGGGNLAPSRADRDALQAMDWNLSTSTYEFLPHLQDSLLVSWKTMKRQFGTQNNEPLQHPPHTTALPLQLKLGRCATEYSVFIRSGDFHFLWETGRCICLAYWSSTKNIGSLAHLKDVGDRRSVDSLGKKLNQMDEFLHHACEGHLVAALLQHLEMDSPSEVIEERTEEELEDLVHSFMDQYIFKRSSGNSVDDSSEFPAEVEVRDDVELSRKVSNIIWSEIPCSLGLGDPVIVTEVYLSTSGFHTEGQAFQVKECTGHYITKEPIDKVMMTYH
ncbi:hypothetical protein Bbelb_406910 [Branchiostoma belcheri]|nr:hypothetical protein Bbelb_406910 [Branchiostoma belcheri]